MKSKIEKTSSIKKTVIEEKLKPKGEKVAKSKKTTVKSKVATDTEDVKALLNDTERLKVKKEGKKSKDQSPDLSQLIVNGMLDKKAVDITIINLKSIKNAVADYFIICSGNSDTQVDAIADSIESEVYKKTSQNPWHKEGNENKEWILLDYIDVVAHVFTKERREFYDLEDLWGDGTITNLKNE